MPSSLKEATAQVLRDRDVDLDGYVSSRRAAGLSWRRITSELAVATQGAVMVDAATLRRWFPAAADDDPTAA